MKQLFNLNTLILVIVMNLTACSAATATPPDPDPAATTASLLTTPTPASSPASSPTTQPTPPSTASPTSSPQPTATNTRVTTVTPTPSPTTETAPMVTVAETTTTTINVRSGPGTAYEVLTQFKAGQAALVTGRNPDSSWWQISLGGKNLGWIFGQLVAFSGRGEAVPVVESPPPPPTATPAPQAEAQAPADPAQAGQDEAAPKTPEELVAKLRCGKDFCITYQTMVPIWDNSGCIGNHSIYVTVLQGLPPGKPMDGVVIGDTFNNVEVASGAKGPGSAEITLWSNTMSVKVKRHIDGTVYTSEESFPFTSQDELIPAEVLAANGYCDGSVEKCRWAQQHNQICRGHYSWKVTFHKFD